MQTLRNYHRYNSKESKLTVKRQVGNTSGVLALIIMVTISTKKFNIFEK